MPLDKRPAYIKNKLFAREPGNFMFSIPQRLKLISSVNDLMQSTKEKATPVEIIDVKNISGNTTSVSSSSEDNLDMSFTSHKSLQPATESYFPTMTVKQSSTSSPKTIKKTGKVITPYQLCLESLCHSHTIDMIPEACKDFYVQISQFASEEFIQCYLRPLQDYEISLPADNMIESKRNVKYTCLLCDSKRKSYIYAKIKENKGLSFLKIKDHLKMHYSMNPEAAEVRKVNNQIKRRILQQKQKIENNETFLIDRKRNFDQTNSQMIDKNITQHPVEDFEPEKKRVCQFSQINPKGTKCTSPNSSRPLEITPLSKETEYKKIIITTQSHIAQEDAINNTSRQVQDYNLDPEFDIQKVAEIGEIQMKESLKNQ